MKKLILLLILCLVACNEQAAESMVPNLVPDTVTIDQEAEPQVQTQVTSLGRPNYSLLFSSERGGDRDLYLATKDGQVAPLLDLPSQEGHGDWSPDGYKIVFFSDMDGDRDLYLVDLRDQPLKPIQLTDAPSDDHLPDWSPDGQYIVFESRRFGQSEIFIMAADGSNQTRLTINKADDKAPVFTPDGKFITFTTFINGLPYMAQIPFSTDTVQDIKVFDDQTRGYVDYVHDGQRVVYHDQTALYLWDLETGDTSLILDEKARTLWVPVFSPDNAWIAYDSEGAFGTGEIYIRHLTTGETHQITSHPSSDWGPDWRPTPRVNQILFDSDIDGDREIYLKDLDTLEIIQLTNNDSEDGLPFWSPDGTQILFFSDRDGDDEIFTMSSDGSNIRQLTFNDVDDRTPSWSHDGRQIAFASMLKGNYDIYVMNTDGSNLQQLTFDTTKDFWPAWSPQDDYITYTKFGASQDTYKLELNGQSELLWENASRCEFSHDGQKVAYSKYTDGHWDIYIRLLKNDRELPVSWSRSDEWVPTWSPDDQWVIFSREKDYAAALVRVNVDTYQVKGAHPNKGQNWRPVYKPMQ